MAPSTFLLLHASINHLNESACIRLPRHSDAQSSYKQLFSKLASLARPGATLLVVDCAQRNLFADLNIKNPLMPMIEWRSCGPAFLAQAGFVNPTIRWNSFNTLRSPGRLLLGNRVAAYCLTSVFCFTMERQRDAPAPASSICVREFRDRMLDNCRDF